MIVPKENEEDIKELAEEIREDVEFMFVDHYREVDRILFETA